MWTIITALIDLPHVDTIEIRVEARSFFLLNTCPSLCSRNESPSLSRWLSIFWWDKQLLGTRLQVVLR